MRNIGPHSVGAGAVLLAVALTAPAAAHAQSPSPETGATLFPGGAVVAYSSDFLTRGALRPADATTLSARPTFRHVSLFTFAWGFRRDFQLTLQVPVEATRRDLLEGGRERREGGAGLGDVALLLKHRFFRRDSERGTTQLSFTVGPKLPTGRTDLRDATGQRLPPALQPGSGSTDVFFGLNATYTGLFHIKRLVADNDLTYRLHTEGSQQMKFGDTLESRFWVSYRPYQAKTVGAEWFIGPTVTWLHAARDRVAGRRLLSTGGDALALGATTYVGLWPGLHVWFAADFAAAQSHRGAQTLMRNRFRFGVTKQFMLPR